MGGPGSGRRIKRIPVTPGEVRFREAAKAFFEMGKDPAWAEAVEKFCRILWPLQKDAASWEVLLFAGRNGWFRPHKEIRKVAA